MAHRSLSNRIAFGFNTFALCQLNPSRTNSVSVLVKRSSSEFLCSKRAFCQPSIVSSVQVMMESKQEEIMSDSVACETSETTATPKEASVENNGQEAEKRDWPWRKAKKVAVMLSFVGKDYLGMQRNPGYKTIEEDLLKAFKEAGAIPDDWYECPQKGQFQRASRTDKGVSAAKMIVSCKLLCEDTEKTIDSINSKLPSCIRVHAIKKVTKKFNCKSAADARTYLYLLPTYAFAPIVPSASATSTASTVSTSPETDENQKNTQNLAADTEIDKETLVTTLSYKMPADKIEEINHVLKQFVGSHYHHNYTSGKVPLEPSSQRYITEFEIGRPFVKEGMEFAVIKVKGQSFMIHQIRKMIGMAIAVVRGHASLDTIEKSWDTLRIDVPRAPGLGLMLDEVHFDRYNQRFGDDGMHEKLKWDNVADQVEEFKENYIFAEMISTEKEELSMFDWLKNLPLHTFEQRHFESSLGENSALRKVARQLDIVNENDEQEEASKEDS